MAYAEFQPAKVSPPQTPVIASSTPHDSETHP